MLTREDVYRYARERFDRSHALSRLAMACLNKNDSVRARQLTNLSSEELNFGNDLIHLANVWSASYADDPVTRSLVEKWRLQKK